MGLKYWFNTPEDGDRKRRRQAEFLVYQAFPWRLVTVIGVINSQVKEQVEEILQATNHQPAVIIRRNRYY